MPKLSAIWQSPRFRYTLAAGILIAGFLLLLWRGGFFMPARLGFNDVYFTPTATSGNIVIVALDDASLNRYGSVPAAWSRTVYADLINTLAATNARVIAFDLLFSEPEAEDAAFAEALINARQNTARTRLVLADAGINSLATDNSADLRELPFADDLPLSAPIADAADYHGYTNTLPDVDGMIRHQPSLIRVGGDTRYAFSIAIYLAYLRIPSVAADQVISADGGDLLVTSDRRVPVDQFGLWQQNYFGPPSGTPNGASSSASNATFPMVSFADVIDGKIDPSVFDGKIVLVGLIDNTGMLDLYRVPSAATGSLMAGVEVQANAIESLIQNTFLSQLSELGQGALIVVLVLVASLIYALPRWVFKIGLAAILVLIWFVICSVVFSTTHVVLNLFDTLLALILPLIASIGIDITLEILQRQQKEFLLGSLQHLAAQRLQLKQAADYILDDVAKIAPGAVITLYVGDSQHESQRFRRGEHGHADAVVSDDPLLMRYNASEEPRPRQERDRAAAALAGKAAGNARAGTSTADASQAPFRTGFAGTRRAVKP